jgi:Uncharacterized protein containing a ferredoxin domain (DUF2148)
MIAAPAALQPVPSSPKRPGSAALTARFSSSKGPQCNLRDIDLGIAVGSAAKAASLYNVDTRCQTRIAVAARKLGLIQSEVAVALSMTVTHKNPGFDARMPAVDFDLPDATPRAPTDTFPVKTPDGLWRHRPDLEPEE